MSRRVIISFDQESGLHRVRNFAEELSLALRRQGVGSLPMEQADTTTDRLEITAIPARKLRRLLAFTMRLLVKHHLDKEAALETRDD